jgi:hypothetical protein
MSDTEKKERDAAQEDQDEVEEAGKIQKKVDQHRTCVKRPPRRLMKVKNQTCPPDKSYFFWHSYSSHFN